MSYSQEPLLELLRAGKVPGESGIPKHIETVISNVFLFSERVYKVYKSSNEFFNKSFHDISIKGERFAFSSADFEWNQQLAKEVYLRLQGVKVEADGMHFVDEWKDAEELLLVTKRLPAGTAVFDCLLKNDLNETDYYEIGKQFAQREKNFVWHSDLPSESLLQNMLERHKDVVEWIESVEEHISPTDKETYVNHLKDLITRVYENDSTRISICIDMHSLNAFYVDKTLYPFDAYSPKDSWRFGPALLNIYRLATDVFALVGEKEFDAVMRGYHEYLKREMPSQETNRLFVIYASLIMVPYLYMIGKTDTDKHEAAVKYHDFLKRYIAS